MMEVLLCQIVFGLSLFGVFIIVFRAYPLLVSYKKTPRASKLKEIQTKFLYFFISFGEKTFRKMKVWLLKAENKIASIGEYFRKRRIYFFHKKKKE